jgi:hypothetical protein
MTYLIVAFGNSAKVPEKSRAFSTCHVTLRRKNLRASEVRHCTA